ncbi:uncharacterized protein LOC133556490 isoform X2 [Nerophis ophidion]|uniref:uncharacterized protein LOC133556490 isoform X2 n=1 Tax=Nerophis ophidion TaxID=159077 RepID=UPI002AE050B6|nr:uncharacterized protein LOC133556490 isoform X2 [Nerophis ophidion]
MRSKDSQVFDAQYKVKDQQIPCSTEVHVFKPSHGSNQCKSKKIYSRVTPETFVEKDLQCHSAKMLNLPSSVSISKISLILSESDQAETDFKELHDEYNHIPQLFTTNPSKNMFRGTSDPNLFESPEIHKATLATEEVRDADPRSKVSQKCIDEITDLFITDHSRISQVPSVNTGYGPFTSSKEDNTKFQLKIVEYPENMHFIDDDDPVQSVDSIFAATKCKMVNDSKNIQMACDSTDSSLYSSISPDSDKHRAKTASSCLYLPITEEQEQEEQDETLSSTSTNYDPYVYEKHFLPPESWTLNDYFSRMSSPESVMSVSDYRAMSPDSPLSKRKDLHIIDNSWTLFSSTDKCNLSDMTVITVNNTDHSQSHLFDFTPEPGAKPKLVQEFHCISHVANHSPPLPLLQEEIREILSSTPNILSIEHLNEISSQDLSTSNGENQLSNMDCRPLSPQSQTSQCSFSFLEVLLSEPTRAQLKSQYCDYLLLYSGDIPTSPLLTFYNTPVNCQHPGDSSSAEANDYHPQPKISMQLQNIPSVEKPASWQGICVSAVNKEETKCGDDKHILFQCKPPSPKFPAQKTESKQSFLDYWFTKLAPQSSNVLPSTYGSDVDIKDIPLNTKDISPVQGSSHQSWMKESTKVNICLDDKFQPSSFTSDSISLPQIKEPIIFNFVEKPKYTFKFPKEKIVTLCKKESSTFEKVTQQNVPSNFISSSTKPSMSLTKYSFCPDLIEQNKYCNYFLQYSNIFDEVRPLSPQSVLSDVALDTFFSSRLLSPDPISFNLDTSVLWDCVLDIRASSPESVVSAEKALFCPGAFGENQKHNCNYYLNYSEDRPVTLLSTVSDNEYSVICFSDLFDSNRPESPESIMSENIDSANPVTVNSCQTQYGARPFTYADVVCGMEKEYQVDHMSEVKTFKSQPILLSSDSLDELSDYSSDELVTMVRPHSPESVVSQCEYRLLSPDSPIPHFDVSHIQHHDQCFNQRSYTPESIVSDWEENDLCLTKLFDEASPISPQSVLSELELDTSLSSRALSPDSVSCDQDMSLLQNWLLDLRVSYPESVVSNEKGIFCPETVNENTNEYCNYYLRYSENGPATTSNDEYSELCVSNISVHGRQETPESRMSEYIVSANQVIVQSCQPQSCARPFTYADVVRGFTHEKQGDSMSEVKTFESQPIFLLSDSLDDLSDYSSDELITEVRPYSPESVMSQCEHRLLSPDSPIPHFDVSHIQHHDQCFNQRSYTPESIFSDWEENDLCLGYLFDETRPNSPKSVSSELEFDTLHSSRALSPDFVSYDEDRSLLQTWLLDLRVSSPESVVSVERGLFCPETVYEHTNKYCNYYLRYSENRPATTSNDEYSELRVNNIPDRGRQEIPESRMSENIVSANQVIVHSYQPQSCARPFTYADVVRGFTHEKQGDSMSEVKTFESQPSFLLSDSLDDLSDYSSDELTTEVRPHSPESVMSKCEYRLLSLDSPIPHFYASHIQHNDQCFNQRSYTPESIVSDWEENDLCLTHLFDEARPIPPQSVLSELELDTSQSSRALSPDSVSSDQDTSLRWDWLFDFRASSPESVVSQCEFSVLSPDSPVPHVDITKIEDNQNFNCRSCTPESIVSDWEENDLCLSYLFDETRPISPKSVSSELEFDTLHSSRALSPDFVSYDQDTSLLRDWLFDFRASSPESVVLQCEFRVLSPDSPVPHVDIAKIEDNQHFNCRSCTPESIVSDWEENDLCLSYLFDETRPNSPKSVSSELECYTLHSSRALSPDFISYDQDMSLLQNWLLDLRVSSLESVVSVEKGLFCPETVNENTNKFCNYYLRYSENRPATTSNEEYSELCVNDISDRGRQEISESRMSETMSANQVIVHSCQPQSCARPFTYADVVRGFTHEKQVDSMSEVKTFESQPIFLLPDYLDDLSDYSSDELTTEVRPYSPESVMSQFEYRLLSPDSPIPQFDVSHIQHHDQCFNQRSYTPESIVSDWEENDLCLTNLFDEARPISPQSVLSELELDTSHSSRALSPDFVSSDQDTSLLRGWLFDIRASSPESVVSQCEFRVLSPDSPVPHVDIAKIADNQHFNCRSCTPESFVSDWEENDLCLNYLFDETRPISPESISSELEFDTLHSSRALFPDFVSYDQDRSLLQNWLLDLRVSSPESVVSVKRGLFCPETFNENTKKYCHYYLRYSENRPATASNDEYSELRVNDISDRGRQEIPESRMLENIVLANQVIVHSCQPQSCARTFTYADVVRGFTHEKQVDSMSEVKTFESQPIFLLSDSLDDLSDYSSDELTTEVRPYSPEPVMSQCEHRLLSPDSPIPHFVVSHIQHHDQCFNQRSYTPESIFSDWEENDLCLNHLFDEARPISPQSVLSELELDTSHSSRALSLDSVSSGQDTSVLRDWLFNFRASSPESVVSHFEFRVLSPDSPVPHVDIAKIEDNQHFNCRSCTPESIVSDWEENDLCLSYLFDETRPNSPKSVSSELEFDTLHSSRALSPDFVSYDQDRSLLQNWLLDLRVSSPESLVSVERGLFCPETVYEHTNKYCNYYLRYSENRPATTSNDEYSELRVNNIPDRGRQEIPESRMSEYIVPANQVIVHSYQPQSCARPFTYADVVRGFTHEKQGDSMSEVKTFESQPSFLLSDSLDDLSDYSSDELTTEVRPHFPESVMSKCEYRLLSLDSPIPHFYASHIQHHDQCFNQRSYTPESIVSDWEVNDLCLTHLFDEARPISPQSVLSELELDTSQSSRALSPDSVSSDQDTSLRWDWLFDFRASSPESVVSQCEFRVLSPDSPVPHVDITKIEGNQNFNCRSCTPESIVSDWEDNDFIFSYLFDETRPISLQSVSSELELDTSHSSRALFPDSVSSDLDMSLLWDWLLDFRASSPESVVAVEKGIFHSETFLKNTNQYCNYYLRYSEDRPTSFLSTVSDVENSELCFNDISDEGRPESPESIMSESIVSANQVIVHSCQPQSSARPFTYADIVRGFTHEYQVDSMSEVKTFESEPIFLLSDPLDELSDFSSDELITEVRPHSPESVVSLCEYRLLSPDSPIPHFDKSQIKHHDQCFNQRLCTPESIVSDWEGNDLYLTNIFDEARPLSPQSVLSDLELDTLFCSSVCFPDSESSDLDKSLFQDRLLDFKASSSESLVSVEDDVFCPETFGENIKPHCIYYLSYSKERPVTPLSTVPDVVYSEVRIWDARQIKSTNVSSLPLGFIKQKPYLNKLISTVFDPLYKGKCSCKVSQFTVEKQLGRDTHLLPSSFAKEQSHKHSPCFDNILQDKTPDEPFNSEAEKSNFPITSYIKSAKSFQPANECNQLSENDPISTDSKGLDQNRTDECPNKIKSDSSLSFLLDSESQTAMFHQNMSVQSFNDACLSNSGSTSDIVNSVEHSSLSFVYKQLNTRLIAHSCDPVYKGKYDCNTVMLDHKSSENPQLDKATTFSHHQLQLSHMPYIEENIDFHHAVKIEDASREQTMEHRPHVHDLQGKHTLKTTHSQGLFGKDVKRQSVRMDKSKKSYLPVSTASSKANLSEPTEQKDHYLEDFVKNKMTSMLSNTNTMFSENIELPIAGTCYPSKTPFETTLTDALRHDKENVVFPEQSEEFGSIINEPAQDSGEEEIITSSNSTPTGPDSVSPQLDQLLSDLEEMKDKFDLKPFCLPLLEPNDESSNVDLIHDFKELQPEDECPTGGSTSPSVSIIQLEEDTNKTNVTVTWSPPFQTYDQPAEDPVASDLTIIQSNLRTDRDSVPLSGALSYPDFPQTGCEIFEPSLESNFSEDAVPPIKYNESEEKVLSSASFPIVSEETSSDEYEEHFRSDNVQSQGHESLLLPGEREDTARNCLKDKSTTLYKEPSDFQKGYYSSDLPFNLMVDRAPQTTERQFRSAESIVCPTSAKSEKSSDGISPRSSVQYLETFTSERQLSFEELMPAKYSSDVINSKAGFQNPADCEVPNTQACLVEPNTEMPSLTSDEECAIFPVYAERDSATSTFSHMPPEYGDNVRSGAYGPASEYSDPEPFFDCRQATSDFSETEPDETEFRSIPSKGQPGDSHPGRREHVYRHALLSSGSEDWEDAFVVQETFRTVPNKTEDIFHSEAEELTVCEVPGSEIGAFDDTNTLTREINAELSSMSESSDDELLSTRIVRRRVVIQADEMPDLPTQSVTEEKYKDENGHIVVRKVSRKIIRKCVSSDGVEREEVSIEGTPHGSISVAEGDGYSKVVKRTVLKSGGDHTEVTFSECEGFSTSQETSEIRKVSLAEQTTVVEGKRTVTHKGDLSLASDLPSAQDDFKQGPRA